MRKILVCEDEAAIREFVVFNLQKAGFEVAEAATGEDAVSLFEKQDEHILKGNFLALNALMHVGLSFPFPMLSNPF